MLSDAELLARWREGDKKAANSLLRRHFDPLYRFFRNKVDAEADELIQRTMLAALEAPKQFRGDASFRTYLFTVARNELYRHFRKRRGQIVPDFGVTSVVDLGASPSAIVSKKRRDKIVLLALRRLPLDLQVALELYYWEGLKAREIAEVLEVPLGTAKSRLGRAREQLADILPSVIESPEVLETTVQHLDEWAAALRDRVVPGAQS